VERKLAAILAADVAGYSRLMERDEEGTLNIGDVMAEGDNLFGDGVNVAARVQELAEPGGICVARNVYDHVKHKVGVAFESLGSHRVKNIAEPVAVYRVLVDGTARRSWVRHWIKSPQRHRLSMAVLALLLAISAGGAALYLYPRAQAPGGVPSIAVLPFANMSGDPVQDYLGPGVAEEIITMLSTYPGLRVTSRTSSFVYDKPVKVQQVAQDLGVAYVLEGSVKKSAKTNYITAQLIDAATGDHVWAERFEKEGGDVVALQVDVANRIFDSIAGVRGEIRKKEEEEAWRKSSPSLAEYDYYLRGNRLFFQPDGNGNVAAREIFQEGLAKFPESALLRLKIASTY
jgi:TolB-like protein